MPKYPKTGKPIPKHWAYVRDAPDYDDFTGLMPAPKHTLNERYESFAALLHEQSQEMQHTEENIKAANDHMKEMEAESIRLSQELYKTIEENSIKEATINELNGKLENLEENARNTLSEIQGLKDKLSELETDKATAQTENAELNNQIVTLRADIATKTNEFNELNQTYQTALGQINQLKQNIEQNNANIEEYKNRLAGANEEITKANTILAKLQEEFEQAKKQYNEILVNFEQAKKDNEALQRKVTVVTYNNTGLQSDLDKVKGAFQAEQAKNADLEAKYNTVSEYQDKLEKNYKVVYGENEKNKQIADKYLEQYNEAKLDADTLRTNNKLQYDRIKAYVDRIKGLEASEKEREKLVDFLKQQVEGKEAMELENTKLKNQLIVVGGERDNAVINRDQYANKAVEQANIISKQKYEKETSKLNDDLQSNRNKVKELQEKLKTADTDKNIALEEQKREYLTNIADLKRQHEADRSEWVKTNFEQEGLRAAAIQENLALEKKIKEKINEKEKLLGQLKQQKDQLKDAQMALKNLKDKFGEQDLLQKQIANYEEQKIELENEIKIHKENLSKLKKADKQLNSSPPSGFELFGPAPARQSKSRRTNTNSFFPLPSYSFPPPSYYSPPPPPPGNNFFPSTSYYSPPPPPPNYNPAPPSYLPKWPGDSNKLTLEIKVAGGEGGTRVGLDSNLSPVSRPQGDIISKLPFGPYGIEIFQPERFRKMDTKQDKKKGKKQPTPFQIARSVGKSLFRNLDPLRIRKTSVGTDTTYHALERTPAMFETFGRSTKRRKVTRIY